MSADGEDANWLNDVDVFRVLADPDDDTDYNGELLGVGVDMPESDVYVDWRRDAFPDPLEDPHVSIYGSVDDLQQATGHRIENADGVDANEQLGDTTSAQADPLTNGHDLDPETGEGTCAATGKTIEAETMADLDTDCPHCKRPLSVFAQQADKVVNDAVPVTQSEWSVRELDGIAAEMDVLSRAEPAPGRVVWQSADNEIAYFASLPGKYRDRIGADAFVPPEAAAENAHTALAAHESQGRLADESVRRARQLIAHHEAGNPLPPEYIVELEAHLNQCESQFDWTAFEGDLPDSKMESALEYLSWGGATALDWTRGLVDEMEAADRVAQQAVVVDGALLTFGVGGTAVEDQDEYEAFADELVDEERATLIDLKTMSNPDASAVRYPPDLPDAHDPQILVRGADAETVADIMADYDGVNFDDPRDHEIAVDQQATGESAVAQQSALAGPAGPVTPSVDPSLDAVTKEGSNEIDVESLPDEYQAALEADDFLIYGKASIEQFDREDPPHSIKIEMDALEDALDRFFESEDAPGIISLYHDDIPVGVPVREYTLDEATTIQLESPEGEPERYEFEAGDTLTTHVEDGDGDGRPELWLLSNIAGDSEMAKEVRLRALDGQLNGYSVTIHRNRDRKTEDGRVVEACDLHAVTLGTSEIVKNAGSTFGVAEYQAFTPLH